MLEEHGGGEWNKRIMNMYHNAVEGHYGRSEVPPAAPQGRCNHHQH